MGWGSVTFHHHGVNWLANGVPADGAGQCP